MTLDRASAILNRELVLCENAITVAMKNITSTFLYRSIIYVNQFDLERFRFEFVCVIVLLSFANKCTTELNAELHVKAAI